MSPSSKLGLSVVAAVALSVVPMTVAAQQASALPEGVTAAMVEEGKAIFAGAGLCQNCHAPAGVGSPIAPNLADTTWLHVDGSFESIVDVITKGVAQPKESMVPMAAKGGSAITEAQVKAVAAYVWTLSKGD